MKPLIDLSTCFEFSVIKVSAWIATNAVMHTVLEVQLLHAVPTVNHSPEKRLSKQYLLDIRVQASNYLVSPTRVTLVAPLLIAMRASGSSAYVASSIMTY